jgi:SEC-C motif
MASASKTPRNAPCPCESGKKYKQCCLEKDRHASRPLLQRITAGEIPFSARIVTTGDESAGITMTDVAVTVDGVTTVLLDEPASLTVNAARGDTGPSAVAFSRSIDGGFPASLEAVGNANVVIGAPPAGIRLADSKEVKAASSEGLWAKVRLGVQRTTGTPYFDLLFGVKGRAEPIDPATGQKLRPHLAFRPDGNAEFIRFAEDRCQLRTSMEYSRESGVIPARAVVSFDDFESNLELRFSVDNGTVVLDHLEFVEPPEQRAHIDG